MNTATAMKNFDTGNQLLQQGKLQEAIASYCDAIKLNPTNSWFHHQMAEALAKLGQFDQAVTAYRDAIELNPDFSWSYHHLGDALTQQQQWEESAEAFRKAIELNPEHYGSYVGLGKSLAKLGQLDEAIAAYRRAQELNPDADWINFALAEVLQQKKQSDLALAIANYQRAIELNPDDIQTYHKLLEIQPENCNVWFQLAETLAKQNQLEEAIAAYRQAIQLIQQPQETTSNLDPKGDRKSAIAHHQQAIENNPDQIPDYYKLLELQPDNQQVWLQLAQALVRQERMEEAIAAYRRLIEVSPREEYYQQLGELLGKLSQWDDAIKSYRRALELNPEAYECHHQLGKAIYQRVMENPETFFSEYNLAEAPRKDYQIFDPELPEVCLLNDQAFLQATANLDDATYVVEVYRVYLRRTLSDAEKQGAINWLQTPGHSRELALNVWRTSLPEFQSLLNNSILSVSLKEAVACCRRTLELNPYHCEAQYHLGEVLAKQGKLNESAATYYQLSIFLAEQGQLNEAVACFQKAPQRKEGEIYDRIWRGLNQQLPMEQTNYYDTSEFDEVAVSEYFYKNSEYIVMNMGNLTEADKIFLEKAGISLANLELIGQDSIALEEIYINSFATNSQTKLAKKDLKTANYQFFHAPHLNQPNAYQQSIVETGYIYAVCPVSGKIIRTNQSFYDVAWLPMISYRFVGGEIFYLTVGHFWGQKFFIYFPRLELIVNLFPFFGGSKDVISRLKTNMVTSWKTVKTYIDTPQKEVVSVVGLISNIGHYLWNELTGIYYLYENELLSKISHVLVEPHEYYNIGDIFPEVCDQVIRVPDKKNLFQKILSNNYCAVRVTNVIVKEQLATRIYEGCWKRCSSVFLEEVEQAKKHFPLLWFGIRTQNKAWVSQVEGITNIIKALQSDFPNLGVVLDGWTRIEREDAYGESMIEKDQAIKEQILRLLPPEINTYTTIGSMIYEKIVWTSAIDTYVIPLSSGNMPLWIANKPGVMHANTGINNEVIREQMTYGRENAVSPIFIALDHIVDQEASPYILSVSCQNYDLDWRVIYNEIIKIIKELRK